jgi:hypothetical protein
MKLANMHLVTGYAGYEHVTAVDQAAFNIAMFGSEQWVINKGKKLSASVVSSNKIRVKDGEIYMQGRFIRLNPGEYVDLAIENGKSGYMRNDLIVARYTKNAETGVEEVNLAVIKGTAVTSDPADPTYTNGNIVDGKDFKNEMPLYRVPIDGLNVQDLVPLFTVKSWLIPGVATDIGAVPDIYVGSADYDMEEILLSGRHARFYRTNGDTKGTPHEAGLTTLGNALILSYAGLTGGQQGFQIAFTNGGTRIYVRRLMNGSVDSWEHFYSTMDKPNVDDVDGAAKATDLTNHTGNKSNPHNVTAEQVGAVPTTRKINNKELSDDFDLSAVDVGAIPVVDATSAEYDIDVLFKKGKHLVFYKIGEATLGKTPSFVGKTSQKYATILSYATSDEKGIQIAFISGSNLVCVRRLYGGTIGEWGKIYTENNKPNAEDVGAARIETGGYTGTGNSGSSNPTEITLSFVPKILFVRQRLHSAASGYGRGYIIPCDGLTDQYNNLSLVPESGETVAVKMTDTTVSFYADTTTAQLNNAGTKYFYTAIG